MSYRSAARSILASFFCFIFISQMYAGGISKDGYAKPRLAVMTFDTKNVDEATVQTITELMQSLLENSGLYVMVERAQIARILNEQKLQYNGSVDENTAIRIGKMLGAEKLVLGSVNIIAKDYMFSVRIVDVETGQIDRAGSIRTTLLDIREGTGELVSMLVEKERKEYENLTPPVGLKNGSFLWSITTVSPHLKLPTSPWNVNGATLKEDGSFDLKQNNTGIGVAYFFKTCFCANMSYSPNLNPGTDGFIRVGVKQEPTITAGATLFHRICKQLYWSNGVGLLKSSYTYNFLMFTNDNNNISVSPANGSQTLDYYLGYVNTGISWMITRRCILSGGAYYYAGSLPGTVEWKMYSVNSTSTFRSDFYKPELVPLVLSASFSYCF